MVRSVYIQYNCVGDSFLPPPGSLMAHGELIRVCVQGAETTVSFSPDHINRTETAIQISSDLCQWIRHQRAVFCPLTEIVIDFREIDRIGSAGLNSLIWMRSQSRNNGVRLVLANVQQSVRDVFVLTRLERMFEFRSSELAVAPLS